MLARLIKSDEQGVETVLVPFAIPSVDESASSPQAEGGNALFTGSKSSQPLRAQAWSLPAAESLAARSEKASAHRSAEANVTNIENARQEASRLVAEAKARAAEIEREAHERGLTQGRANADVEIGRELEPLRARLAQTLAEMNDLRTQIMERSERELVRLAIEIAKKVTHREVTVDHEIVLTLARVAVARLSSRTVAAVHLHPDDYAYVNAQRARLETNGSVELVEDRSVGRGGCLVRTDMGDVDARIEQQFAEIERSFLNL